MFNRASCAARSAPTPHNVVTGWANDEGGSLLGKTAIAATIQSADQNSIRVMLGPTIARHDAENQETLPGHIQPQVAAIHDSKSV
jgi:hypothetical protein